MRGCEAELCHLFLIKLSSEEQQCKPVSLVAVCSCTVLLAEDGRSTLAMLASRKHARYGG
jgi:hypothetical protein